MTSRYKGIIIHSTKQNKFRSCKGIEQLRNKKRKERKCIMGNIYKGTLGLIGNTPLVEVVNVEKELGLEATLLVKLGEGITYDKPEDVIKDTYTLEFLGLPEKERYSEEDLEQKIIDNLQKFLLELGKGFTFVGRQYPLTVNNIHYHVDLVFYHRILKCFVLIDLKKNSVQHIDIGKG